MSEPRYHPGQQCNGAIDDKLMIPHIDVAIVLRNRSAIHVMVRHASKTYMYLCVVKGIFMQYMCHHQVSGRLHYYLPFPKLLVFE